MTNKADFSKQKDYSTAVLERKKAPNRLVVEEAVNDDNSVVTLHPATMEKLGIFRGDTILIKVIVSHNILQVLFLWIIVLFKLCTILLCIIEFDLGCRFLKIYYGPYIWLVQSNYLIYLFFSLFCLRKKKSKKKVL